MTKARQCQPLGIEGLDPVYDIGMMPARKP
jgi:hypothetical protein